MTKFEFQPFDKVLVRDGENQTWRADLFSHKDGTSYSFCGISAIGCKQCIPYNETTKHLCGTSDPYIDPAEAPAFEFGDVVEWYGFVGQKYIGILAHTIAGPKGCLWAIATKDGTSYSVSPKQLRLIRKGNFND